MDLSGLTLVPATSEQITESRRRTHPHWSRGLTLNEYIQRYRIMDTQDHAKDGKMTTWVLAPRDNSTILDFKCSCETYKRTAILARHTAEGELVVEEITAYGITSVFTPPENRRKGYASHMMRLLHWVLAPHPSLPDFPQEWGVLPPKCYGDARFSVLYSDVGDVFYHNAGPTPDDRTGWVTTTSASTIWNVPPNRSTEPVLGNWQNHDSVKRLWALDSNQMRTDVARIASEGQGAVFAFLPSAGVSAYNIQLHMRFTPDLEPVFTLQPWGVQLPSGPETSLTYATWTFEPIEPRRIVLTRFRASQETFLALLEKVFEAARDLGVSQVETWNLPQELAEVAKRLGGKTIDRDEHLSSVRWYSLEKGEWLFNEKFCWC